MKVIPFVKFSLGFVLFAVFSFSHVLLAESESTASISAIAAIEKRLATIESQEKKILENQAEILQQLHTLRIIVRRS